VLLGHRIEPLTNDMMVEESTLEEVIERVPPIEQTYVVSQNNKSPYLFYLFFFFQFST